MEEEAQKYKKLLQSARDSYKNARDGLEKKKERLKNLDTAYWAASDAVEEAEEECARARKLLAAVDAEDPALKGK